MSVLRKILAGSIALPLAIGLGAAAHAQAKAAPATKPDADALAALNKMGAALRALTAFTITADVTTEQVLENGQKLQYGGDVRIEAQRPGAFKISTKSERQEREIYYDGKSLTVFAPTIGYYASVPAPSTIGATLDYVSDKYGVEVPLADLFSLGVDPALTAKIQSGFDVGPATVDGKKCEHYAFRQKEADWQVWISSDGPALPCKMVVTTTQDPAQPQYTAVMKWESSAPPQAAYTFNPPANAHRITLADAKTGSAK
ncbi:hypothetical protein ASD21_19940 [Caulobacter sp. Root1455]|uniref:DUF2092 domain-containing protein n=1 Tax=Caulobacter sp. Root1455 TaxID=1736465 RepID=UPI0006F9E6FC|nr:DUF2092 domain-containing protein [Caulobacter sp. Root1455]KQZ04077.1 hypothetical protein ASD21_19940 [Caulobacter sp. Root1455]